MKERFYKNDDVEMWLENGVVYIIHKPSAAITLDKARHNVAERLKICDGKTYPVFADIRKVKAASAETREYLSGEDSMRGISAGAFLVSTHIEVWIFNLWLRIHPVNVPTKLFNDKDKALK